MPKKLSLQHCIDYATTKQGKCLSTEYKNNNSKMRWECKNGHILNATFRLIKEMEFWCYQCKHIELFFNSVNKNGTSTIDQNGNDLGQCWNWTGPKKSTGYGRFYFHSKTISAHRFSFLIHFGKLDEQHILHKCIANPSCVNPDHLYAGNHQDNMNDKVQQNRQPKGSGIPTTKLTEQLTQEIRQKYIPWDRDHSLRKLAKEYNLNHKTIHAIISNKTWKYI